MALRTLEQLAYRREKCCLAEGAALQPLNLDMEKPTEGGGSLITDPRPHLVLSTINKIGSTGNPSIMYVMARGHHSRLWSVRLHDHCFLERLTESRIK